jgi:GntR family transcriptional regulator, transcriptional repressor for pyruvate dehydrogenase complex
MKTTSSSESPALFGQVKREPRLSDKVADMMLETIVSKRLKPGDRLPSERELGEQFGVSRTVVREAVRALVAKGLIEVRSGSGLRVAAVDASAVSESMSLYIHGSGDLDYPKVHEVRTMLEVQMAGLAAQRRTEDDIARLTEACERMEASIANVEVAARADVEFHREIAKATHNELYLVMLDAVGDALVEIRRGNLKRPGSMEFALDQHRRILDAIATGATRKAREAMREHLDRVEATWREWGAPDSAAAVPSRSRQARSA